MTVVQPDAPSADPPRSETIEELFAALESPLLSYALRLLGDRAQAEDAVQDAFMKLHTQFAEVREPRRWLYRTVQMNTRTDLSLALKVDAAQTVSAGVRYTILGLLFAGFALAAWLSRQKMRKLSDHQP